MKHIRMLGLCLVAALAMGAIASASASAHAYKIEGTELTTSEEVAGTSETSKLEAKGLATIECTKDTFTGSIEKAGKSTGKVEFKSCKVVGAEACAVVEPIKFKFKDELTEFEKLVADEFKPETGETFVTIELEGAKCAITPKKLAVKGTQICKLPEAGSEKEEHSIECTPAGSKLKLGTVEATFKSTEKVHLSGKNAKKKWSAT
jgi:hypothetical protein